jgi:hypothetical protein
MMTFQMIVEVLGVITGNLEPFTYDEGKGEGGHPA